MLTEQDKHKIHSVISEIAYRLNPKGGGDIDFDDHDNIKQILQHLDTAIGYLSEQIEEMEDVRQSLVLHKLGLNMRKK